MCSWPHCRFHRSGKTFASRNAFKKHLRTHIKAYRCIQDGCTYDKPFATAHDLNRHVESIHTSSRRFPCPIESCDQRFSRRDKLDKHIKTVHNLSQCSLHHCGRVVVDVEAEKEAHFKLFHQEKPSIECELSGCELSKSLFNKTAAAHHLRTSHSVEHHISHAIVGSLLNSIGSIDNCVMTMNMRYRPNILRCKTCTELVAPVGFGQQSSKK